MYGQPDKKVSIDSSISGLYSLLTDEKAMNGDVFPGSMETLVSDTQRAEVCQGLYRKLHGRGIFTGSYEDFDNYFFNPYSQGNQVAALRNKTFTRDPAKEMARHRALMDASRGEYNPYGTSEVSYRPEVRGLGTNIAPIDLVDREDTLPEPKTPAGGLPKTTRTFWGGVVSGARGIHGGAQIAVAELLKNFGGNSDDEKEAIHLINQMEKDGTLSIERVRGVRERLLKDLDSYTHNDILFSGDYSKKARQADALKLIEERMQRMGEDLSPEKRAIALDAMRSDLSEKGASEDKANPFVRWKEDAKDYIRKSEIPSGTWAELGSATASVGGALAGQAISMIPGAAPIGQAISWASIGAQTLSSGGQAIMDMEDYAAEKGVYITPEEKATIALGYMAAEFGGDAFGGAVASKSISAIGKLAGGRIGQKLAVRSLAKGIAGNEGVRQSLSRMSEYAQKPLAIPLAKSAGRQIVRGAVTEGPGESLTTLAQNGALDRVWKDKEDQEAWADVARQAVKDGIYGAWAGALMGGFGAGIQSGQVARMHRKEGLTIVQDEKNNLYEVIGSDKDQSAYLVLDRAGRQKMLPADQVVDAIHYTPEERQRSQKAYDEATEGLHPKEEVLTENQKQAGAILSATEQRQSPIYRATHPEVAEEELNSPVALAGAKKALADVLEGQNEEVKTRVDQMALVLRDGQADPTEELTKLLSDESLSDNDRQSILDVVTAQSRLTAIERSHQEAMDQMQDALQKEWSAKSVVGDETARGAVISATITDADGKPKQVYVTGGVRVVTNEDGTVELLPTDDGAPIYVYDESVDGEEKGHIVQMDDLSSPQLVAEDYLDVVQALINEAETAFRSEVQAAEEQATEEQATEEQATEEQATEEQASQSDTGDEDTTTDDFMQSLPRTREGEVDGLRLMSERPDDFIRYLGQLYGEDFVASLPMSKKGVLDLKALTPEQTLRVNEAALGKSGAVEAARQRCSQVGAERAKLEAEVKNDLGNLEKRMALRKASEEYRLYDDYVRTAEEQARQELEARRRAEEEALTPEERQRREEEKRQLAQEKKDRDERIRLENERRRREREELERNTEGSTVREYTEDPPRQPRTRGARLVNGTVVYRQEPMTVEHYADAERAFSQRPGETRVPVKRTIVEAESLQASHKEGRMNPKHFIPEAQPKDRADNGLSSTAADRIASDIRPDEITGGITAYTGAPVVNGRGEVIQGNNRTDALQTMYDGAERHAKSAERYKEYLKAHASEYGMTAEQVDAMAHPVAVDVAEVSDSEAIRLGHRGQTDLESAGTDTMNAQTVGEELNSDTDPASGQSMLVSFFNRIFSRTGANGIELSAKMDNMLNRNAEEGLQFLHENGYITDTQYKNAFETNSEGKRVVTAEAKTALKDVALYQLADVIGPRAMDIFYRLPASARNGLATFLYRDSQASFETSLAPDLGDALLVWDSLRQDPDFAGQTNFESAKIFILGKVSLFGRSELETNLGEASSLAKLLAASMQTQTEEQIASVLNNYYDLVGANTTGAKTQSLIPTSQPTDTKAGAAEAVYGRVYEVPSGREKHYRFRRDVAEDFRARRDALADRITEERRKYAAAMDMARTFGVPLKLHEDMSTLPEEVRAGFDETHFVKGWFYKGDNAIHIYLPANVDADDVRATFLHEAVGHYGCRELLGEVGYNQVLDNLANKLGEEEVLRAMNEYCNGSQDLTNLGQVRIAMDEWIAHRAESGITKKTVWESIKDFFRKVFGLSGKQIDQSAEMMADDLLRRSAENLQKRAERQQGVATEGTESSVYNQKDESEKRFRRAEREGDVSGAAEAASDFMRKATPKNTSVDDVLRFLRVYHNSPHLLKKADGSFVDPETGERLGFDHRFIGSGEGFQAHGWGSYFSVNDLAHYASTNDGDTYDGIKITKNDKYVISKGGDTNTSLILFQAIRMGYRTNTAPQAEDTIAKFVEEKLSELSESQERRLAKQKRLLDGLREKEPWALSVKNSRLGEIVTDPKTGYEYDTTYSLEEYEKETYDRIKEEAKKYRDALEFIKRNPDYVKNFTSKEVRHKYQVEIPDPDTNNYIEEDRRLTKHEVEMIRDALNDNPETKDSPLLDKFQRGCTGGEAYELLSLGRGEKRASSLLSKAGFVGIHYNGRIDGECYVIFNESDAKITDHYRFRRQEAHLAGVHTLTTENLRHALKMGGLANPSIAVYDTERGLPTKTFGEVALIAPRDLVDAKTGRHKGTYNRDAWTPTYPQVSYELTKSEEDALRSLSNKVRNLGDVASARLLMNEASQSDLSPSTLETRLRTNKGVRKLYESERRGEDFDRYVSSLAKSIEMEDFLFVGQRADGSWKKVPHTLDNVSKLMKRERAEGSKAYPFAYALSKLGSRYRSLSAIRKGEDLLSGKDQAKWEATRKEFANLANELQGEAKSLFDIRGEEHLAALLADGENLFGRPLTVTEEARVSALREQMKALPTDYFETKVDRPVELSEFVEAVVPEGTSPELVAELEKSGLKVSTYDSTKEGAMNEAVLSAMDRADATDRGVRFRTGDIRDIQADDYGSKNRIVTKEEYANLIDRLRDTNTPLSDVDFMSIGRQLATFHIEAGSRSFRDFVDAMITDMGDRVRPYLKSFYNGARDLPSLYKYTNDMDWYDKVSQTDVTRVAPIAKNAEEETPAVKVTEKAKEDKKAKSPRKNILAAKFERLPQEGNEYVRAFMPLYEKIKLYYHDMDRRGYTEDLDREFSIVHRDAEKGLEWYSNGSDFFVRKYRPESESDNVSIKTKEIESDNLYDISDLVDVAYSTGEVVRSIHNLPIEELYDKLVKGTPYSKPRLNGKPTFLPYGVEVGERLLVEDTEPLPYGATPYDDETHRMKLVTIPGHSLKNMLEVAYSLGAKEVSIDLIDSGEPDMYYRLDFGEWKALGFTHTENPKATQARHLMLTDPQNEAANADFRFRRAERAGDVSGAAEVASDFMRNATSKNSTVDDVLRFLRVYHNSPHLLKKADGSFVDPESGERLGFDHRFMGSGEGAQAHGWGSYFSVKDLEGYGQTEQLIPYEGMPEMTISKDDLSQYTDEQKRWAEMILDLYNDGEGDVGNTFISPLERLYSDRSAFDELYDSQKEANTRWDDFVDFCKNRIEEDVRPFHNKYVVEIPNLSDSNYLEEDAPLSEKQASAIKQTMEEKSGSEYDETFYSDFANNYPEWNTLSGGTLYKTLSDYLLKEYTDSPSQAAQWTSEMLNEAGLVGIHYNGQRDGECYVIFNENDAEITARYRFRRTTAEEREKIIENANKYGLWMHTPDGTPTTLSEEAWIAARTIGFKAEYGDWEKASNGRWLIGNHYVEELSGNEFEKSETSLIDMVANYYEKEHHGCAFRNGIGYVSLSKRTVKDSMAHFSLYRDRVAAFKAVPEVIKRGVQIDEETEWKGRSYDSLTLSAPISIGGEGYICTVIVKLVGDDSHGKFYLHKIDLQKNLREDLSEHNTSENTLGEIEEVVKPHTSTGSTSLTIANVLKEYVSHKDDLPESFYQANGEPKREIVEEYLKAEEEKEVRYRRVKADPMNAISPINPQWDGEWYSPEDLMGKSTADLLELPAAPATPEKRPTQSVAEYAETMSRHNADPRVRFRTGAHTESLRAPQPPRITDGMSLYEVAQLQHEYNRNYRDYLSSSMKRMDALVTTKGRFIRYMVDSARPVELFCKEMERMGIGMTPEQNVYQDLMTQSSRELNMRKQEVEPLVTKLTDRIRDLREQKLLDKVTDVSYTFTDEDTNETKTIKRADGYDKVSLYFQAKDIVECEQLGLVSRGREGFEKVVTEAGKPSNHITPEAYIASFEASVGKANAEALCDDMRKMSRWSIDRLHGAGLMTDDQYRSLTQSPRRYYAPQRGFKVTEESDRNAYERVEMTAEGRQSLSGDPIAYMQAIMNTTVMRVVRNQDLLHLYEWVTQHQQELARRGVLEIGETYYRKSGVDEKGNPIYMPSKQAPTIEELRHDSDVRRQIAKLRMEQKRLDQSNAKGETAEYVYGIKSKEISNKISDLNNSIEILYRDPEPLRGDEKKQNEALRRTVKVYKDGVEQQIHFSPQYRGELVADVLNGRASVSFGTNLPSIIQKPLHYVSKATRFMSALMTQYNPNFAVTNALRDYGTALISNVSDFGWGYQRAFMANYAKVQATVLKYTMSDAYGDGSYPPGKYGTYLKEFFDEGAATGWSFLPDVVKIRQTMKEMSDPSLKQKFVNGKYGVANAFGLKQGIGMLTEASELNTRFAEYVTSRERGFSSKEAAKHAKELTVNFNRKGTLAGVFGSFFGFWNASIQGTNKIVRLGRHGAEWCGTLFAGGLAQGLLYALGAPDKDDERAFTEWEMMTNICIGDVKIPLPQGFRGFWGAGVQMALALAGKKDWQGGVIDGMQYLLGELLPSEVASLSNIVEWDDVTGNVEFNTTKVIRDAMPTAVQPEMDVILNMDFMGNPVYREPFIKGQEGQVAQRTLGKKRTKQVYKDLSDKIWYAMGGSLERNDRMSRDGTHILPDDVLINPSVIEHVFEGRTTGIGKTMADIATCVSAASSGDPSELRKLQIVNVLTKQEKDYSDSDRSYWKLMDFYNSRQQTMNNLRKAKKGEDFERYKKMTERVDAMAPQMTGEQLTEKIWADGTQDEKLYVTWLETKALIKQIGKGKVTKEEVAPTIDRLTEQFRELR